MKEDKAAISNLDTEGVDKGGVFEPVSDTVLRSTGLIGSARIEIEFVADVNRADWPGEVVGFRPMPLDSSSGLDDWPAGYQ